MSTPTRVFVARLAGIGVFDPSGDQLGRVRDAVTTLRVDRQPPRVLGLVVELQQRHRIFVPMGRVTRIEPDQVVLVVRHGEHEALRAPAERDRSCSPSCSTARVTLRETGAAASTIVDAGDGAEPHPRLGDLAARGAHDRRRG